RTWQRVKELLAEAADLPAPEREVFLGAHCPDEALRREVREMLAARADLSGIVDAPSLPSGTRLGPYEILDVIGIGGMGQVYRAPDRRVGREIAIKVLPPLLAVDPDRVARFEREARLLASLNHPHIAQIHGVAESDGQRALVMELVEGPTLADRIQRGPIPL